MNLTEYKNCINNIDESLIEELKSIISAHTDIIILGNGGSSAIASHISQDYTKVLNKRAFTFSDSSRLTCYINDYGHHQAYVEFLKSFANKNTLVILISSSGESNNIVNCLTHCNKHDIKVITMSGFNEGNRLNVLGNIYSTLNIWINSNDYGIVELTHELILHSII